MNKEFFRLIVKRILSSLFILFLVISFVFVLIRVAPGDPSQKYISPKLSPELVAKVKESFQLNTSITTQYFSFILNLVKGNLGFSYSYHKPVIEVISDCFPFTLLLSSVSFFIQIITSFILSIYAGKKRNGLFDRMLSGSVIVVYTIPTFVLGLALIYLFSIKLNIFPSSGLKSFDANEGSIVDYCWHLVLPVITLSLGGIAVFYKYLRDNIEDVYNKTFIKYLRTNGYTEKEILRKHIIPNAINPVISVAGVELGLLLGGTLITEVIFSLPGMGRLTMNAILYRDYPLIVGCTLTASILMLLSNFIADLLKATIDKRFVKGLA